MGGFGAYGKIPALGDFFAVGATRSFRDPWDRWLQGVLLEAGAGLGARWDECYMSAPLWRFQLGSGIAGPAPASGVLMPSVDRVGRRFPLTLVSTCGSASWDDFAQIEEIALATLEDGMTREKLADSLAQIPVQPAQDIKGAQWSAILSDQTLCFTTSGLPTGTEALKLFDLGLWPETTDQSVREHA